MAGSPIWKVYTDANEYIASCKYLEDAAILVAGQGSAETTIRYGHARTHIIWTEGKDGKAFESYDAVAVIGLARVEQMYNYYKTRNSFNKGS
jgi:hypothetical protein